MKTFLGFTTGLFSGTLIGMVFMATMLVVDKDLREFLNTVADDTDDT